MDPHSTKLLSVLAVGFIHLLFAVAMVQIKDDESAPRWVLLYLTAAAFYGALYFRRRLCLRGNRGGIYRGLGYTAAVMGAFMSLLLFFFSVAVGKALPLTILVWLVLAVAAYFLYRVTVLHLDDEEVLLQVGMRPPI